MGAIGWVPFDPTKGQKQRLPAERQYVMVLTAGDEERGMPPTIAIGWMKYSAGDKNCPYFVVPGVNGERVAWNDCVPACLGDEPWMDAKAALADT